MITYPVQMEEISSNRTYSLKLLHIGKLSALSQRLNRNHSELMREAIDDLFEKYMEDSDNGTQAD